MASKMAKGFAAAWRLRKKSSPGLLAQAGLMQMARGPQSSRIEGARPRPMRVLAGRRLRRKTSSPMLKMRRLRKKSFVPWYISARPGVTVDASHVNAAVASSAGGCASLRRRIRVKSTLRTLEAAVLRASSNHAIMRNRSRPQKSNNNIRPLGKLSMALAKTKTLGFQRPLPPDRVTSRPQLCPVQLPKEGRLFLPDDVMRIAAAFLNCVELDRFRATSKLALAFAAEELWERCRLFSCPSASIGGIRTSSSGRRLTPRRHDSRSPTPLTLAFISCPRLSASFERIHFRCDLSELPDRCNLQRLLSVLLKMPHLQEVILPERGWPGPSNQLQFLKALKQRGVTYRFEQS